jgi:glycosyltransferase involved in cell wall biosynthesis
MADDEGVLLALQDTASTGVRVVGMRVLHYAIGFVASIVIARALGPAGRGFYAFPVAFLGIVMAFSHLGLEHANVFLTAQKVPLHRLWGVDATAAALVSLAAFGVVALLRIGVGPSLFAGLPTSWLVVTVSQLPVLLAALYWAGLLQLEGRLRLAVGATLVATTLQTLAVLVMAWTDALTPFRVLVLAGIANLGTLSLLLWAGTRAGIAGVRFDGALLRRAIAFGAKAHVATIFTFLLLRVDQVLVQRRLGFEQLGVYSLAVVLAEILWLATDPFAASLLPHQVRAERGNERRLGFATARLAVVVALAGSVIAWIAAPYAIRLAYGDAFEGAVWPFRLLLPGVAALALQRPLGPILVREGRIALVAAMNASALTLNVALNLALLPSLGVQGASVASSITYTALAIAYVLAVRRPGVAGFRDLLPGRADLVRLRSGFRPRTRRRLEKRSGPPRAVLVIGTLDRGGTEGQVVLLARGLLARGWVVSVLCLSAEGSRADEVRGAGGEVLVGGFRGLTPLLDPRPLVRTLKRIRGMVRSRDPDVVHAFLYWGTLIGVWAGRSAGAPVVVASQRSLRSALGSKAILGPWERRVIRWSDAWLCNAEAVRADAVSHGIPAAKARVVPNGIEPGPAPTPPPANGAARILIVANLIAYKGHRVALEAFATVLERCGRGSAELRLAGSGPEEEALRLDAARLGIADRVVFLGSVPDVAEELESCRCTVLPSHSEGLPNAVLESMAAGRAVVASDVGGVAEALAEGGGVLVPVGDAAALADQVSRFVLDPRLAATLGEQGRRAVLDRFGAERMVEETISLYEELGEGATRTFNEPGRTRTGSSRT